MCSEGAFIRCDIAVPEDADAQFDVIGRRYGGLDRAFNNAAAWCDAPGRPPLQLHQAVYDTNVRGIFLCLRRELKIMIRQPAGSIVNTGSIAGMPACLSAPAASMR